MQLDTLALVISVASFIGVILGPITTNLINARQAAMERRESRRSEMQEFLIGKLNSLIKLRSKLQYLQGESYNPEVNYREESYGEAYAIMLSISDEGIRAIADKVMKGSVSEEQNEKLDAINESIMRLGDLIDKIMKSR